MASARSKRRLDCPRPRLDDALPEMEAQTCLGPKLHALGFPVPEGWGLLRDDEGAIAAGYYRYVDGQASRARGLSERRYLARQIASFLSALHAVDPAIARDCGANEVRPRADEFSPIVERRASELVPGSEAWIDGVAADLEALSSASLPLQVVHSDLQPAHLICDQTGEIKAVLDFEGPRISDPAMDFARLIQFWGAGFARMVLRDYRGATDLDLLARARCYANLEPLRTLHVVIERDAREWDRWATWARRTIAGRAAAALR